MCARVSDIEAFHIEGRGVRTKKLLGGVAQGLLPWQTKIEAEADCRVDSIAAARASDGVEDHGRDVIDISPPLLEVRQWILLWPGERVTR